jgi:NADPH:quinone reductase-like Zn-dependent oxidoreductase
MKVSGLGSGHRVAFFVAKPNSSDLGVLAELIEAGKVRPVIDRCYALDDVADGFRRLAEGHARGKIVVRL